MKRRSELPEDWDALREKIIGLGERSVRKSYYPELQQQYAELKRFRQLLDQSSELILVFDVASLRVVDANTTACQTLKHLGESPQRVHLSELHPTFGEMALEAIARPEQSILVQAKYGCADGTVHTLDGWIKVVTVDDQQTGMLIVRDISIRIQAEQSRVGLSPFSVEPISPSVYRRSRLCGKARPSTVAFTSPCGTPSSASI